MGKVGEDDVDVNVGMENGAECMVIYVKHESEIARHAPEAFLDLGSPEPQAGTLQALSVVAVSCARQSPESCGAPRRNQMVSARPLQPKERRWRAVYTRVEKKAEWCKGGRRQNRTEYSGAPSGCGHMSSRPRFDGTKSALQKAETAATIRGCERESG